MLAVLLLRSVPLFLLWISKRPSPGNVTGQDKLCRRHNDVRFAQDSRESDDRHTPSNLGAMLGIGARVDLFYLLSDTCANPLLALQIVLAFEVGASVFRSMGWRVCDVM